MTFTLDQERMNKKNEINFFSTLKTIRKLCTYDVCFFTHTTNDKKNLLLDIDCTDNFYTLTQRFFDFVICTVPSTF